MHNIFVTEDWRTPLAQTLIDLRGLARAGNRADNQTREMLDDGRLRRLASHIAISAERYGQLKFHERRFVEAIARGRNAYEAVLVGRSAARVQGMWVVSLTPEPVEVALPSTQLPPSYRNRPEIVCRRRSVPFHNEVHGVRVTLPIRTFIDIARDHGFVEGLIAADWLLANGFTREQLREALERMGAIRHARRVRRCIEYATGQSQSPYESLLRAMLIEDGCEDIQVQAPIEGFMVDLLLGGWLVIEIDGDVKYADDPDVAIMEENNRQKRIGNLGYVFLRYRPEDLLRNRLVVLGEVRGRLDGGGGASSSKMLA